MKRFIYLFTFFLFTMTICIAQSKYFRPTGIIDRTKEFAGNNIWSSLNNKESIDGYTRIGDSIFGGEISCNIKPLKIIDTKNFQVLPGTKYAKDTNHIYYPIESYCIDYINCGVCFYSKIIVENAKPSTFRYLGNDYAADGKLVFFHGKVLQGADADTFNMNTAPQYLQPVRAAGISVSEFLRTLM